MKTLRVVVLLSVAFAAGTVFAQTRMQAGTTVDPRGRTIYRGSWVSRDLGLRRESEPPIKALQPSTVCSPRRHDQPVVVNVVVFSPPVYDATAAIYAYEESQNYYQPGYEWGAGLKGNSLVWAEFVPYLQQYLLNVSPVAQDAFRRGFVTGFGNTAEAVYDRAMRQACQRG
jgi:hypothetical protein